MAKKVTVVWTDPTPTTYVDHLEVWRKTEVGGTYAQLGADLALGVQTYSDESTLADSTQYYYQVRAYNAAGSYSNVEGNITISGVVVTYGLTSLAANVENAKTPNILFAGDFYVEFKIQSKVEAGTGYLMANGLSNSANGFYGIRNWSATAIRIAFGDSTGSIEGVNVVVADGDVIRLSKEGTNFRMYKNSIDVDTVAIPGTFTPVSSPVVLFDRKADGTTNISAEFSNLDINGETWDFAEQTGTTATGSLGTVITLLSATMWSTF